MLARPLAASCGDPKNAYFPHDELTYAIAAIGGSNLPRNVRCDSAAQLFMDFVVGMSMSVAIVLASPTKSVVW